MESQHLKLRTSDATEINIDLEGSFICQGKATVVESNDSTATENRMDVMVPQFLKSDTLNINCVDEQAQGDSVVSNSKDFEWSKGQDKARGDSYSSREVENFTPQENQSISKTIQQAEGDSKIPKTSQKESREDVEDKPSMLENLAPSADVGSNLFTTRNERLPCLLCEYASHSKEDTLAHMLLTHKFIVADVNFIALLPDYLTYWKNRIIAKPIEEICSKIVTAEKEEFHLLCDALPEDKNVREKLQRKKLEDVLSQQQKEREETKFCRQCLFCKQTFCGNRAVLFDHLLRDHAFHMGQPDNLVFTSELFDLIQYKLDSQLCLFCEKSFKDKASLREHMRKKQHRKINPQNKEYDRFYIINYMEMGKNWESLQSEDNRLIKDVEIKGDEEEEWSGWLSETESKFVCLFCNYACTNLLVLLHHMKDDHIFDMLLINRKLQLNFYQKVKLINYIRRQVYLKTCYGCKETMETRDDILSHFRDYPLHCQNLPSASVWDQSEYFYPTFEDDTLLCHIDDDDDEGGAGDTVGIAVIPEEISVTESILTDQRLCRELQRA